jgi:uncharacterized protein (DUF1800 family)
MGDKNLQRKDFLKKIIGLNKPDNSNSTDLLDEQEDPLFEKYARKTLGTRQYSTLIDTPNNDGSFAARVGSVTSGIAPYTGTWTEWQVAHLLRRVSFGVKKIDLDALKILSPSAAVDALFNFTPAPINPSPTPLYFNTANYADTLGSGTGTPVISGGVAQGADWTTSNILGSPPFGPQYSRRLSLEYWNWGVCINEPTSIREKMQQFWYHFIPVNYESLDNSAANAATMAHDYMKLLRINALGNFKTLIKAISKTPAMLVYLSNQSSTASAPNENFARELLELFTLGKVPVQNYTQADVVAASKVFSGWRVPSFNTAYPFNSGFNASFHNQTNKTFSSFFNNTTINNQTQANGANEFDLFFDMLFTQQAANVSKYICRRLYRFFVYYDIDSNVETNVIVPLANLLVTSNWEMMPVVKALLKSEHFFDAANKAVMIKSPIDFITSFIRTFNVVTNTAAGVDKQYFVWRHFQNYALDNLDQGYGAPPNVAGWKAYYQEPTYYQNWVNSETIQKRFTLINNFISGFTPNQSGLSIKVNFIAFVQQFPAATISNPNLLIDEVCKYLFSIDLATAYKAQLKQQELLGGQADDNYWTQVWNAYLVTPNANNTAVVTNYLKGLFTSLLQLAEYQLM